LNRSAKVTVRLPADLSQALKRASRRLRRKHSDIVRLALQVFLHVGEPGASKPADRVRGLIGFAVYRVKNRKPFRIVPELV
jgi:hypothetical protein